MGHWCKDNEYNENESGWWVRDYQGIELCKVCADCEDEKLSHYRPCILNGYNQSDVGEPIGCTCFSCICPCDY